MSVRSVGLRLERRLTGSIVFAAGVTIAIGGLATTGARIPQYLVWLLITAVVALSTTSWLFRARATTASARAAAEIVSLHERLAQADMRLKGLTNAKGRFVGNIAHELKTPLANILGQCELLLRDVGGPTAVRHYAMSISEEMRHLSDLVESFLRLARPFAQEDTSHHVPVDCHEFVVEAVRRTQSLARDHGVSIVTTLAECTNGNAPLEVLGDSLLLEAMVENLVRNAVRFAPEGSRVEVVVEVAGESICLTVRDHGAGIATEHLASVFDWFFDEPTGQTGSAGSGFGLAIAKRVAEHHSGTIELRNCAEGGCEFAIHLQRWRSDSPPAGGGIAA